MLVESFRIVTARLIPRGLRCKQALLSASVSLAALGLPACGGSTAAESQSHWQTVAGTGFTFQAPAGWKVEHAKNRVTAIQGTDLQSAELVQVATFPLMKTYDEKLFGRVATELRSRMLDIAHQTGGKLSGQRTVTADGVRSHAYDVTAGTQVDEYTFVLSGKREYLLLCRRTSSDGSAFCAQLVKSFARR
jgi:hypothetical protein